VVPTVPTAAALPDERNKVSAAQMVGHFFSSKFLGCFERIMNCANLVYEKASSYVVFILPSTQQIFQTKSIHYNIVTHNRMQTIKKASSYHNVQKLYCLLFAASGGCFCNRR
jgi:hypothetical protein